MQTSKSFGIHFTIRPDKERNGKQPVYACITVNKQRAYVALRHSVPPDQWDSLKGLAKGNRAEVKKLNTFLEEIRLAIGNCYRELQVKGKFLSAKSVKDLYLGENKEAYTLNRLSAYHNETATGSLRDSTMKHYLVTQRYLARFLKAKFKKQDIYLHELDFKFIQDFEVFLRNWKPVDDAKRINHNGIMKHVIRLKKMVNMAVNLGWIEKDPFNNYRVKVHKVNRDQLSDTELADLSARDFGCERLNAVRDMFVFACYTGLSYIDLCNLTPGHIEPDGGDVWLITEREKTSVPVYVPLLPQALRILDLYKENRKAALAGRVFPVISNQKMNTYLKDIAGELEIDKKLTFHMARHTFATTIALSNGMPIETVSKILGHTRIATTQIYARVIKNKISADMKALKAKLQEH